MNTQNVITKATYWSKHEIFDPETRYEVQNLLDHKHHTELFERFEHDLEFGTGGLRGIMGAGTSRINRYTIRRASMALSLYLREYYQDIPGKKLSIAISYDSRINSKLFAQAAAEVFSAHGIKSYLTEDMRPTPQLSFMVTHLGCDAGICITASHNPSQYNGYKVYWKHGGQLVTPHDQEIIKIYQSLNVYEKMPVIPFEKALREGLINMVGLEGDEDYLLSMQKHISHSPNKDQLKIVYTPLHGTGIFMVPKVLNHSGFTNIFVPEEQKEPDGRFPTVSSPNPEDPSSLTIAIDLARKTSADLVLATDPDSDRIAASLKDQDRYVSFNGNQFGCLLLQYLIDLKLSKNESFSSHYIVKTIVTTDLLKKMANHFGMPCYDTLTGFKWIADLVYRRKEADQKQIFLFGAEESYGYLLDGPVMDKDAVLAALLSCEMISFYQNKNITLFKLLDQIHHSYGYYQESLYTLTLEGLSGTEEMKTILSTFRSTRPREIAPMIIDRYEDYQTGQVLTWHDGIWQEDCQLDLPSSNVLKAYSQTGQETVTIRPSGTEPKLKLYFSVSCETKTTSPQDPKWDEEKRQVDERVQNLQLGFLEFLRIIRVNEFSAC